MSTERTTVSGEKLIQVLGTFGVVDVRAPAASYLLLSEADIRRLATRFTDILQQTGYTYQTGNRECRQFARWAVGWAELWHSEQNLEANDADNALAFGTIKLPSRNHEMNVALHQSDSGLFYPACYEPQRDARGFALSPVAVDFPEWKDATCEF